MRARTSSPAPEVSGYDAETGKLVAAALGVEPCFVATPFDSMIAGELGRPVRRRLGLRRDHRVADGGALRHPAVLLDARELLRREGLAVTKPEELSGKQIGACAGCTHEQYLRRTLELPGTTVEWLVDEPKIVTYNTEVPGLEAVANGDIDAFLCSEPVGLAAIKDGAALKKLDTPAYFTQKTGYIDRDLRSPRALRRA